MLKIWAQKTAAAQKNSKPGVPPFLIRLQKDLSELARDSNTDIEFANASDQTKFTVVYRPPIGIYHGGQFRFSFEITDDYPHTAPKVLCVQKIYHPNIDTEGHVCLNVLREDWNPVLNIQSVIFGLQMLFTAPNPEDPLNTDAAQNMINDLAGFKQNVAVSMKGGNVKGAKYDCVLANATHNNKRGNDHGFVFTRVRSSNRPAIPQATPPTSNNNENKPIISGGDEAAGNKRQACSESSPRLDFPEPKRRIADTSPKAVVQELSVPVKKAPQPTPLISRTRTRVIQPSTPLAVTNGRRRATAAGSDSATGSSRMRPVARTAATRKSTMGGRRRSTFSMRGKRASSIGGGFKATPHDSVAAGDFYRHISPELPEPIRLRQLLAWCARRTAANVAQGGWPVELPPGVRRVLDDALREAVDDMHSAFEKGSIATSWYHRPVDQAESLEKEPAMLADHPENVANRDARDRLLARVETLRKEDAAWVRELKRAGAEHARALARLPTSVQSLPANKEVVLQPIAVAAPADCWKHLPSEDALQYVKESASGGVIDAQLSDAERHIDRAVSDLEVALDAFHLDAHRAAQDHARAAETCVRVAADLSFAFTQRRAQAQVIAANSSSSKDDDLATTTPPTALVEDKDCTRDLLRTLAAALARS
ncbi:NEDD8-conjugating protein ubc12 [Coemansia aciculifera]|nr:NEDD8-conjugating protein ubc12 [Coemansia aciculifera]